MYPGLMIFVMVMAFNILGDAVRDALDPHTAESADEETVGGLAAQEAI
jgi:hypothetical protein